MSERVDVTYSIGERQGVEVWCGWQKNDEAAKAYARKWDDYYPESAPHTVTRITETRIITRTEEPVNDA